jgi:replicative DNA helicase
MAKKTETQMATGERIPPQAVEVEQAVLGAMLLDKEAIGKVFEIIGDESYFYKEAHQKIYSAIVSLYDKNEPVDLVTLPTELAKQGQLDSIGGRDYLFELTESVVTSANIEYHAKIVLEKGILRKLIEISTQIASSCYDFSQDVDELLDQAEQQIFTISEKKMKQGFVSLEEILPHTFASIEEFQKREGAITGRPTGFIELDQATAGLHPSELIIVAGRPSMGKTAFALCMAEHLAIEKQIPVGIFSLEMSAEQLALRMLCSRARVNAHLMRIGRLPDNEWSKLSLAVGPLSESKIFIDDSANIGVLEMRAKARRLKAQHDVGLIIVDYLQLMQGPKKAENRQQEIAHISRSLKGLAKELDVPVVALSQLSRQAEQREGPPKLSDLRESGAIEQDADAVLFLHQPEKAKKDFPEEEEGMEGMAQLIIGKQRNGPTGIINLVFVRKYIRFENPDLVHSDKDVPFYLK